MMEVKIQTKFNKGDIVDQYLEEDAYCTINCPFCGGKRYIKLDFQYQYATKMFGPLEVTDKIECHNCNFNGKIRLKIGGKVRTKSGTYEVLDFNSISEDGRIYYKVKDLKTGKEEICGEHHLENTKDDERNDGTSE